MKFIVVSDSLNKFNGFTARNNEGIGGSDAALMYLAEGLAEDPNNVVIVVSTSNTSVEGVYLNVNYINICNFNTQLCDYIITTNVLTNFKYIMNKIMDYNKIIILTQNDLYKYDILQSINKDKIIICYISQFAKENILTSQPFLKDYDNILIHNSINLNEFNYEINNKENALCFFACVDRGYQMVVNIHNQLNNYILYTNTYANHHRYLLNNINNSIVTENSSIYTTYNYIAKSKYFIYPLINLDNNMIHYDTFAYVVLEALLLGTIVITPKIKVFEELYGDAICYIDTDDLIPQNYLTSWNQSNANFGLPLLDRYVEKIRLLDNDDNLRNSFIKKGLLLKNKYSHNKISSDFMRYLKQQPLIRHLSDLSNKKCLPDSHINYLKDLKIQGFEPKVIYDIGSCVLHWTTEAKKLWPNAKYILFDAISDVEFLYQNYDYYLGVLSDVDNKIVKFYQNDYFPGGNSYYREIGCENGKYFPENKYIEKNTKTLDTLVKEKGFPLPDLVKIDVQGAEVDIIKGGINTLKNITRMIVELQHTEYNLGALKSDVSLPLIEKLLNIECSAPLFTNNGCDGDYGFINRHKLEKTILTIFAGREQNLNILCKYLRKALKMKIIDEVHLWNNTRNLNDDKYIKSISNLKRTSSTGSGNYILITPIIIDNTFDLVIKASNDIHIKITNNQTEYEIVLGGWNNTRSIIRKNNDEISNLIQNNIADGILRHKYTFSIKTNSLNILKNNKIIMSCNIDENFQFNNIYFKTGYGAIGDLDYESTQNNGFYLMDTCEKSWKNYYQHYSSINYEYEYSTILKCDDDIVFIDLQKLPDFINCIKNTDCDLVFANTINNGVSAYYQQNKYNLIPKQLMDLEYPINGYGGSLWESGTNAEKLHNYFIENNNSFINYNYNKEIIPIKTRFSINFFGYKAKNWHKIKDCYIDDECLLTVDYVKNNFFNNILFTDFYVSHLSFYKQNETGINLNDLITKYDNLYTIIENNEQKLICETD
jgi:FkbM family methyltransferase